MKTDYPTVTAHHFPGEDYWAPRHDLRGKLSDSFKTNRPVIQSAIDIFERLTQEDPHTSPSVAIWRRVFGDYNDADRIGILRKLRHFEPFIESPESVDLAINDSAQLNCGFLPSQDRVSRDAMPPRKVSVPYLALPLSLLREHRLSKHDSTAFMLSLASIISSAQRGQLTLRNLALRPILIKQTGYRKVLPSRQTPWKGL